MNAEILFKNYKKYIKKIEIKVIMDLINLGITKITLTLKKIIKP